MENKDIQIRISDIFASLLKSIVLIVIVTIIFGALLGAFGAKRAKNAKIDTATIEEDITKLKKDIDSKEESIHRLENSNQTILNATIPYTEKKVARDEKLVESRRKYSEESIYYSIDPYDCGISRIRFVIDVAVPEDAKEEYASFKETELSRLVNACTMMKPLSDDLMAHVKSLLGTDAEAKYVDEIISINNIKDQIVELTVVHTDPEMAKKVADYIYEQIKANLTELSSDCIISEVTSYTGKEVNWDLNNALVSYQDSHYSAERNLVTDRDSITQNYKQIEDNKKSIDDYNEEIKKLKDDLASNEAKLNTVIAKGDIVKNAIKFGIVGAVAGLVLACAYVYVRDVIGTKVRNRNNILSRYSYPLLGVLPSSKKYLFDKTVKKLEGDAIYEKKEILASSSASVLAAVSADGGKACLIGPVDAKDPALADLLKSLKGQVEYKGNILSGSDAIKNLESYDKVILVEKRNNSRYDSINEEISRIHALKKEVLGFILL